MSELLSELNWRSGVGVVEPSADASETSADGVPLPEDWVEVGAPGLLQAPSA
jgi:hypothetical protein